MISDKRKIIVIGCPGSGKSYFAKKMAKITKIPIYHLDLIYWRPNWETMPKEEFRTEVIKILEKSEWIIDGNYNRTIEDRFKRAELVYFLDLPTDVCLENERERRGKKRDDFPTFLCETQDPAFIQYIKDFKDSGRVTILSMIKKYPSMQVITIKSRNEMNRYLANINTEYN